MPIYNQRRDIILKYYRNTTLPELEDNCRNKSDMGSANHDP